jgi:hypothetical protein
MTPTKVLIGAALTAVAVGLGFLAGISVILLLNVFLPPFRPEDDETLRELVPAALAYGTWAVSATVLSIVAWRRLLAR